MGDKPDMGDMPNMPGGMSAGGGSDLNYTDDNLDSYEAIWEGTITDTDDADHTRVVEALKKISEGDLSGVNVDLLCKYMAVQTFVVNLDSLSGNMTHNYYLYEKDGQLTLIPWDYNLTWGGFMSGDASDTINFAIDTPVSSGVSMEDRQIFAVILNDEEACALYHSYLEKLCTEYVQGGQFELTYTMLRGLLDSRVATDEHDPTAFYTAEEYTEAVEMLKTVIERRAESILGQLDGTIPSTNDGQRADSSALIDASDLDLSIMGSMMGGMGGGPDFFGGGRGSSQDQSETGAAAPPQDGQERESPATPPAPLEFPALSKPAPIGAGFSHARTKLCANFTQRRIDFYKRRCYSERYQPHRKIGIRKNWKETDGKYRRLGGYGNEIGTADWTRPFWPSYGGQAERDES